MSASELETCSDNELVAKTLRGQRDALSVLYDRHYPWVFRYLVVHLGDRHNAEDTAQEVFLKVIDRICTFRGGKDVTFAGWLFRVTRNTMMDFFRKEKVLRKVADNGVDVSANFPDPQNELERSLLVREMDELILGLSPAQQEVITLRFKAGLSIKQTAAVVGKAEGTVKALQFQALRMMRRSFILGDGIETDEEANSGPTKNTAGSTRGGLLGPRKRPDARGVLG